MQRIAGAQAHTQREPESALLARGRGALSAIELSLFVLLNGLKHLYEYRCTGVVGYYTNL